MKDNYAAGLKCPICGQPGVRDLFRVAAGRLPRSIRECGPCGAAFLFPPLSRVERDALYGKDYFNEFYGRANRKILEAAGLGLMDKLAPLLPAKGRVLDVGAAWGCYLAAFRSRGWETEGVEMSAHARAAALEVYDFRLQESLLSAPYVDGSFDLVLMSQFLEHVPDPLEHLGRAYDLLKTGGVLYISVPNFGSPRARALKQDWPELRPGEHLFFYTRRSLGFIVKRAGLRVLRLETPRAVVTREGCAALIGGAGAGALSAAINRYAPWLKDIVRRLAGACREGEGLELVAVKGSR
ncbi:MAG: class I SAM-dependent methyltransferase [Elusimicrobia bacterium]|nr:class I SAM-dependent methyltransferase [Elusimicrobiota bacterium]